MHWQETEHVLLKTVPTATHLLDTNETTHLKYIRPLYATLLAQIFSTLHFRQTVVLFGTTLP